MAAAKDTEKKGRGWWPYRVTETRYARYDARKHVDSLWEALEPWFERNGRKDAEGGDLSSEHLRYVLAHTWVWDGGVIAVKLANEFKWPVNYYLVHAIHKWSCTLRYETIKAKEAPAS